MLRSPGARGAAAAPSSTASDTIKDVAPYWRLAWQQNFGVNFFEVGTYGMFAQLFPAGVSNGTNKYTDVAFDAMCDPGMVLTEVAVCPSGAVTSKRVPMPSRPMIVARISHPSENP